MTRREFLQAIAAAAAPDCLSQRARRTSPQAPRSTTASSRSATSACCISPIATRSSTPIYFREPNVNLGVGAARGKPPHLVGEHLLKHFGIAPGTRDAHAFTYLDFARAAQAYGQMGGFAHLATLVNRLRASRPGALLLDGGDTWQGSATSLWTRGPGHDRRAETAGRRRHDRPLGIHLRRATRQGSRRARFCRQDRFHRAEREDRRFRRPGVQALRDPRRSTACRSPSSARRFRTRRSPIRATSSRNGRSASRKRRCRRSSTRRGQGRASRRAALAQRDGRRSQAGVARHRDRRHPGRPYARRRPAADRSWRNRGGKTIVDQRRQQRQVPRGARPRREGRQGRRFPLPAAAGVQHAVAARSRPWTR